MYNKLTSESLFGNWATLLLATEKNGELNFHKLSDEIDILISSSPDGIYSNGTACEFYSQSFDEFCAISGMLAEKCHKAGVKFQIGVSHPCPDESVERLKAVLNLRPWAVQVILPDWFPVDNRGAIAFLERMSEIAGDIPIVLYNPPHSKRILKPEEWSILKKAVPALIGVKVFDNNRSPEWYDEMRKNKNGLSVFVPGHHLASGILNGASGAYSNIACLNPFAAQKWYDLIKKDMDAGLELETRINRFMAECIDPFIVKYNYPNHACDRFMANVGAWAPVGAYLRWPYSSIPEEYIPNVRRKGHDIIPEFI